MKSSHGLMHLMECGILLEVCQIVLCKSGHARDCKEIKKIEIHLSEPSGADLTMAHCFQHLKLVINSGH